MGINNITIDFSEILKAIASLTKRIQEIETKAGVIPTANTKIEFLKTKIIQDGVKQSINEK